MNVPKDNSTSNKAWNDHEIILPKSNSIDTTSSHQTCCTGTMSTKEPQQKHPEEEEDDDELPPHILRWKNLIVPRAHEWKENDEIVDGSGSPIIKIIQHKKFATPSGPGYSVSIGIPGSETVLAYLERSQEPSFKDHFHLITIAVHFQRNHDDEDDNGQQQDHARGRGEEIVQHIYGKLTQGVFGREYTYSRRSEDGNEYIPIMKAKNARVTLSAFPGLYLPFLCKKFTLKFYSVKHPERLLFTRNQNERFVEFGSKISTTEAVCLAFAIDRMTNPCNCETLKSSQLAYKGNFNFKPGRILGGHW